ncbi:aminomethyltransferase [Mesonia hippocampi]|uniref:Aminomethyltransferase n=1 Tax=Mesonia hippocampi TaxID=1628250 RepID=A0A840EUG0_9FLAO|nr:glycine cleavage system aminomethyltransferase GcvT [Mesonia hippocampi]MBB4117734.1 aminomethyltransferase [Mesonia hippocampi]
MKTTALNHIHKALGAKMVPYAGFEMPVQYEGVNIEHQNVREHLGVFDVSHMGEFIVSGPNAVALLQKISSNDVSTLTDGKAQYAYMPNDKGGVVDDLIIYRFTAEKYLLVVNASNIEKDWAWIEKQNKGIDAELRNVSDDYSLLAIQGPKAVEAMQQLTDVNLSEIKFYHFVVGTFAGIDNVIISATGYTGSGGFEIYFKNDNAESIWNKVFEAGKDFNIKPIGLAARDTLRLEMGFCLYGNDIDETTSPIEAGLSWITKFTKDFVNAENLKKEKEEGPKRRLIAFELTERGIPRKDYLITDENDNEIGIVTSGTMSPSTGKAIGLGYVNTPLHKQGSKIFIKIRKKNIPATIVKLPFYKK